VAEFGPRIELTEFVERDLLLNYQLTPHHQVTSTHMNNVPIRRKAIALIMLACTLPFLGSCGIPTDDQPRDINQSQQTNLNKP
jgi:hypothetical protein